MVCIRGRGPWGVMVVEGSVPQGCKYGQSPYIEPQLNTVELLGAFVLLAGLSKRSMIISLLADSGSENFGWKSPEVGSMWNFLGVAGLQWNHVAVRASYMNQPFELSDTS